MLNRELLSEMLSSRSELRADGVVFHATEGAEMEVLAGAGHGVIPITRVSRIELHDRFLTVTSDEATLLLPFTAVVGVKVTDRREAAKAKRTGFGAR